MYKYSRDVKLIFATSRGPNNKLGSPEKLPRKLCSCRIPGGEGGEDVQVTQRQQKVVLGCLHMTGNSQESLPCKQESPNINTITKKLLHAVLNSSKDQAVSSDRARRRRRSRSPMSRSPHLLPPAAGPGGKAHGAGCLPCLCCQHEPSKTFMGRGYFTSAEQGLVGAGGERAGSRLLRGINALSSLTPIHILTWRAARFPGKQVIQSSCCPVMIFSLPRLPPQTQSRSL